MPNIVAFIPARAGSKGVRKKNIRLVAGKPLIEYTIECALGTPEISDVVITTNCKETKAVVNRYPIKILDRPDALAQDDTPTFPVIAHALEVYEKTHPSVDIVLLLQCTSPLRTPLHISAALGLFNDPTTCAVTSVMPVGDEHPARMYRIENGHLHSLDSDLERLRRQDLPQLFRRNGAIYAIRRDTLIEQKTLIAKNATAYIMPADISINIDTETDLALADLLISRTRMDH